MSGNSLYGSDKNSVPGSKRADKERRRIEESIVLIGREL